jgi:hypothetical protein
LNGVESTPELILDVASMRKSMRRMVRCAPSEGELWAKGETLRA